MDADDIVRAMHLPGGEGARLVRENFGSEFIRPDGGTDRAKLAGLVFSDGGARNRLDELFHPAVREALSGWKRKLSGVAVCVALIPLLFEKHWQGDWDCSVCVSAPEDVRFARLLGRGLTEEQAAGRISAQMPDAERRALADVVVMNGSDAEALAHAARILYKSVKSIYYN